MNLIYGFAAGLLFSMVILSLIIVYGRSGKTWDASKDNFQDEMMGYWKNTAKYQGSYLKEMENQTLALRDILEELKKMNELTEGK